MAIAKKNKACVILFLLQLVGAVLLTGSLVASNMIPVFYLIALISIEVILLVVSWEMFFLRVLESSEKALAVRRIIAAAISIAVFLVAVIVAFALGKASDTLKEITSRKTVTTVVGVYVLADDAAQNITDAADYDFGYSTAYDGKNVQNTIKKIKREIGKSPKVEKYEDPVELIDALYAGDVDAIVLSESYASVVESQEGYETFAKDTRLIYEYEVVSAAKNDNKKKNDEDLSKFIVYLSGSDTRSKKLDVSRSDVNILMVVNTKSKEILLINTPRDYYVPISVSSSGKCDKLTHCGIYGIDCSMDTLSALYKQDVNYYAQINFTGFETLVDAVDGITVYSDKAFTSVFGNSFKKGENNLNGELALDFARDRKHQAGGDNGRGQNEMKVITAIINKLSAGTVLTNYSDILDSLQGMFVTDMSTKDINALVKMQLKDRASWNIHSYAVTGSDGSNTTYSIPKSKAYVMYPDEDTVEKATELMEKVLNGETLTDADLK